MIMNTRELEVFLAVADTGSITAAAQSLGCSQPHVTRTIQEIERELGLNLLERVGRRIVLSDAGLSFEGEARQMLQAFAGLADRVRDTVSDRILRVAATPAIGLALMPIALGCFRTSLPEIHIVQSPANTVARQVRDGMAEIGFSSLPLDVPGLNIVRRYAAAAAVVLHRDDPLAGKKRIRLEDFAGRQQVTMLDPMRFQRQASLAFAASGVTSASYVRTNAASTALQLVRQLRAIALLDPITAWSVDGSELVTRPVDADIAYQWGVVVDPSRKLRAITEELIEHFETVARDRIAGFTMAAADSPSAPNNDNPGK